MAPCAYGVRARSAFERSGFTLVELVVVMGIVGTLTVLLLGAVVRVREAANRTRCIDNLRQMGLALSGYHEFHHTLPPGLRDRDDPYLFLSWQGRLLPFMDQEPLWHQTEAAFAQKANFLVNPPHTAIQDFLPFYACPSDPRLVSGAMIGISRNAPTSYLGVAGTNQFLQDGVLYLNSQVKFSDITDGTSNTLLVGERPPSADGAYGWWYAGWGQEKDGSCDLVLGVQEEKVIAGDSSCAYKAYDFGPGSFTNPCDTLHFWSPHPGGANFLFCDGSVHFLNYAAAPIMPALATRRGGEAVSPPD